MMSYIKQKVIIFGWIGENKYNKALVAHTSIQNKRAISPSSLLNSITFKIFLKKGKFKKVVY